MAIAEYTKNNWNNGDVLHATALNNIDIQLERLTNAVNGYDISFSVPNALSASSSGITMTSPVTISNTATTQINAATTIDAALVASGNVTLGNTAESDVASNNPIHLKGPVTAYGTVNSKNKLTVESGGLEVTAGGATITAGGATITAGGLTVSADGMTISGTTTLNGATNITNNLKIKNGSTDKIILDTNGKATIKGDADIAGTLSTDTIKFKTSNFTILDKNSNTLVNSDNTNIIFNKPVRIKFSNSLSMTTIDNKEVYTPTLSANKVTAYEELQVGSDETDSCNFIKGQIISGIYDSITTSKWDIDTAYAVNDKVFYNNSYYKCTVAQASNAGWDDESWSLINTYLEIVGNGTSNATSNARTLDINGNEWIAGEISANNLLARNSIQTTILNLGTATTNNNVTTYSIAQFNNDNITLYKPTLINNDLKISGTLFHNEYWSPGVDFYNANSTYTTNTIVFNQSTQQYQKKTASGWEIIDNPYLEIIGNGTANTYSNARMLDREGNEGLAGDLVVNKNLTARGNLRIGPVALSSNITASTFLNSSLEVEGNAEFNKNVSMGASDLVTIGSYADGPWFLDLDSDPVEGWSTGGTLNIYSTNIKIGLSGEEEDDMGIVRNSTTNIYGTFIVHDSITFSASGSTVTLTKADVEALLQLLT